MNGLHEEWLSKAEDDLHFAEVGLKEGFYAQVCFLSQQVIEKSLKGAMVATGKSYPKSHNLRELARRLPQLDLKEYREQLTVVDGYYVPVRYPDAIPGSKASGQPNKAEAAAALKTAREIFNVISKFIAAHK